MSIAAVRTIVRREVRDTLTDWRILTPIFILTFILPQLLIAAATTAINFIGDPGTIVRLLPFAMLLVGFIPASFSLITALETFVGERERNSLESLLSMPISDSSLYAGKLLSSLLPPLLSALLAMLVYTVSLALRHPDLYASGMKPEFLVAIVLLILIKAVVMVAGAVIISSHTTSIRAANLLASFVLLPTASIIQMEALLMIGERWDVLWLIVILLIVIATALIRTGVNAFNREEILSREHEQLNLRQVSKTFKTFLREYQPAGVQPNDYAGKPFSASYFYRQELPRLLREYRLPIAVACLAALSGIVLGGYIGQRYNIVFLKRMLDNIGQATPASPGLAIFIFLNNARVALLSGFFSLFVFGAFAFLVPAVAFTQISYVASELSERGGSWLALGPNSPLQFLLAYVLPHGIIELPAAILSAAMGLRVGAALLSPPPGFTVGQNILWALAQMFKIWALVLLPLFLIGSMIEGLITPHIVMALYQK